MSTQTISRREISWEQDYDSRVNPDLMTKLLRTAIPVLEHSGWYIDKVEEGFCQSVLPLNCPTTNQHGTHQAALISLSADYTGGLALATLLRGVPLAGVHRCKDDESASLWLAAMNVKYHSPSSGHLTGTCRISDDQAEKIRSRYFRGSRVLVTLDVEFHSNGDLIAVAEMKYFAQPTVQLTPAPGSRSRSTLFSHKLKASARMIAALRAMSSSNDKLNVECPHAELSAGPHGAMLAARLQTVLPQLKDMVLARTQHIDEALRSIPDLRQVVMLGAGLDMRSLRHADVNPNLLFFEVDLPEMIAERRRVMEQLDECHWDRRVMMEADFRNDDLATIIAGDPRFDADRATLFIYEGCSMYFSEAENRRLLSSIRSMLIHPESCLWMDLVSREVVTGKTNHRSISAFLDGMAELGESFIFGVDDASEWLNTCELFPVTTTRCGDYLNDGDLVLDTYTFSVSKAS